MRGGDIARLLLLMRQCVGALIRNIGIAYADLGWSTVLRHATHSMHLVCLLGCTFNGADLHEAPSHRKSECCRMMFVGRCVGAVDWACWC